jgi:hypothetical protein
VADVFCEEPDPTLLMKLKATCLAVLAVLFTTNPLPAEPFTYQGHLENSGVPFTGTASIRLSLYSALTGGSPLRTETFTGVTVIDGVFTVKSVSMLATDFNGSARFLNLEVSPDGTTWTPLAPRQELTWTPMAMHAKNAETVTGTVPANQLSGTLNPALLGSGSIGGAVTFAPLSGAPFSVGSTTKVVSLNSDLLDGLDSGAFLLKSGGAMTGDLTLATPAELNFGNAVRQMINLWGTDYGIGVQTDTLYQRSNNDFSWFIGGVHHDSRNQPGSGGTEAMRLTAATSTLWLRPGTTATPRGRLLFGDVNLSSNPFVAIGEAQDDDDTLDITAEKVRILSNSSVAASITFPQNQLGQHLTFFRNATENFGIGVQGYTQYFRTSEQFSWYKGGVHANNRGDAGGGTTLMTLDVNGNLILTGAVSTTVLTIRGGADVAEPFAMTQPAELEPGAVVVIDENHAGRLKLSTAAYDTKVAGIISGAGGVRPGLRLQQDGVLEGDHHVALSGRAFVKADASAGPIRPGDLLTTSANPGHAMKVADHGRAQGAILGKAMTGLDSGTGLVLVLVTLQ